MDVVDRLHVRIHGLVQGVGFRYSASHEAVALGLTGWVRNVPGDGVEADLEGDRASLERMLAWCREGPPFARVERVDATWGHGARLYERFVVRG